MKITVKDGTEIYIDASLSFMDNIFINRSTRI